MKKFIYNTIALSIFTLHGFCGYLEVNYSSFQSIEEVIDFETARLVSIPLNDYEGLSEALISRAESYLLSDNFEKALNDYSRAYDLSSSCNDNIKQSQLYFSSLFGMIVAYCNLDMENEALEISQKLNNLIDKWQCHSCRMTSHLSSHGSALLPTKCVDIQGPNYNEPGWCDDVVMGTAEAMRYLASLAKTHKARIALLATISALESRCLNCCATGEFWKICVAPIAEKWKLWNDKNRLFGIPPDPAWD